MEAGRTANLLITDTYENKMTMARKRKTTEERDEDKRAWEEIDRGNIQH